MQKANFVPEKWKEKEKGRIRVHFLDLFAFRRRDIKRTKSFIVYLPHTMSCEEIVKRIKKAFE